MGREKTRENLLSAAREIFAVHGYHDAKVDDIAGRAKVAKGTFYLYFPDKRAIFSELVDDVFDRLRKAILRVDVQADIEQQVRHNIRAVLAVLLDEPALTRILLTYAEGLDAAFMKRIRAFYTAVRQLLEQTLADGQKMGLVARGNTADFAVFTVGALKEIMLESASSGFVRPREELVEAVYAFLSRGFLRIGTDAPVSRPAARRGSKKH